MKRSSRRRRWQRRRCQRWNLDAQTQSRQTSSSGRRPGQRIAGEDSEEDRTRDRTHQPGARPNCYCPQCCRLRLFSRCRVACRVDLPPPNCCQVRSLRCRCHRCRRRQRRPWSSSSAHAHLTCLAFLALRCRSSSSAGKQVLPPQLEISPEQKKNCSMLPGVAAVVGVVESAVRAACCCCCCCVWEGEGGLGWWVVTALPLSKSTTVLKIHDSSRSSRALPGSINSWKRCRSLIRPLPGHAFCHFLVLRTQQRQTEAPQRGRRAVGVGCEEQGGRGRGMRRR